MFVYYNLILGLNLFIKSSIMELIEFSKSLFD